MDDSRGTIKDGPGSMDDAPAMMDEGVTTTDGGPEIVADGLGAMEGPATTDTATRTPSPTYC
jgi:hypothetical protein